jgi:tRNA wybutosine-synthesizing protein 1
LSDLIGEAKKRGRYVFLVTNGALPERLEKLENLPTQLYVSMDAPDEETYFLVCRPHSKTGWEKYLKTLDYMKKIKGKTRTVLRMTLVRDRNDHGWEGYAKQIKQAEPDYVEVKSFVFVGGARNPERGLRLEDMLKMDEIREIGKILANLTGYVLTDEHVSSRVVLLCRDKKAIDERFIE